MMTITTIREQRTRRVLVAGGGIAGTVAAIALRRAGLEPILAEAFPATADGVGAFLTLAPNGVRGLRALDLEAVTAAGFPTPRFRMSLGNGRLLAEMSAGVAADGTTTTIRRADLYRGLRQEVDRRGIRVEYGKRLVEAQAGGSAVVARFADGSEIEADLLVGADGIHSRVRALLDPRAPKLRYLGLLNTGGFARGAGIAGEPGVVQFVFGKRCFFGWTQHPGGEIWWFANPGQAREPDRAELAAITAVKWRARLLDLFSADASPAAAIIGATERIIGPWPTHDLAAVPRWRGERMIIIGDAAHAASPSSGQGASMAIEDAIVLAKCLRDIAGLDPALAAYEQLRRRRVEKVVALGRRNGTGKTPGPFGRAVRDLFLRAVMPLVSRGDPMAWVHGHQLDWPSPVPASPSRSLSSERDLPM